ncbi:MAG: RNA polymerase sigma factor [Flavobacteriaceae bacterium]|nr:RNA polymerase sigma factor [Flavobacteriaceae bacterium]
MSEEINLLIEQCKRGNQKAQLQVYNLYCEAIFFIACRYLKNEEEAKDAMQEGFLKAFLKMDSNVKDINFGAWLKRIIINQCLDVLKKKKLETISLEDYSFEIIDDDDWNFDAEITKEKVVEAIDKLPEKYRLVINLYLIEGYDHSEISEIMEIPIKTSRTHLRRGKLQLKELLKEKKYEARY